MFYPQGGISDRQHDESEGDLYVPSDSGHTRGSYHLVTGAIPHNGIEYGYHSVRVPSITHFHASFITNLPHADGFSGNPGHSGNDRNK